jgi:selenide,water dikinase
MTTTPSPTEPRLTSLSHGGGCGCKIAPGVLSDILKGTTQMPIPKELLVGIETADDAAVYRLNDEQALIATTDFFMPIVDDPFDFGRIAATNAISDVYAMGGTPIMALALVGMPINVLSLATIGKILEGGASVCREAGIPIAGGHTIDSVEPIYGLVALGLIHPKRVKRNADARVGDVLVLGKPLGVGVMSAALKKNALGADGYAQMMASTTKLNTPGPDLAALDGVHALTDVTGFGLAGHALEIARGANCTVHIDWAKVPLLAGVRELAGQGMVTGASGRNWAAYGAEVTLPGGFAPQDQALVVRPADQRRPAGVVRAAGAGERAGDLPAARVRSGWRGGPDRAGRRGAAGGGLIRRRRRTVSAEAGAAASPWAAPPAAAGGTWEGGRSSRMACGRSSTSRRASSAPTSRSATARACDSPGARRPLECASEASKWTCPSPSIRSPQYRARLPKRPVNAPAVTCIQAP